MKTETEASSIRYCGCACCGIDCMGVPFEALCAYCEEADCEPSEGCSAKEENEDEE